MKQRGLKQPVLGLMAGLPGVGKTTLAKAIELRLVGLVVLEKDLYQGPLLEVPQLKENFDKNTAGWAAYEITFTAAKDFLVTQQLSVIIDSSLLHPFILKRAKQLAAYSGAQLKIILCEVDEETRQHRLLTRERTSSQSNAYLVPKEAAKYFDRLDPSSYKRIWTKLPLETCVEEALTYVTE